MTPGHFPDFWAGPGDEANVSECVALFTVTKYLTQQHFTVFMSS